MNNIFVLSSVNYPENVQKKLSIFIKHTKPRQLVRCFRQADELNNSQKREQSQSKINSCCANEKFGIRTFPKSVSPPCSGFRPGISVREQSALEQWESEELLNTLAGVNKNFVADEEDNLLSTRAYLINKNRLLSWRS